MTGHFMYCAKEDTPFSPIGPLLDSARMRGEMATAPTVGVLCVRGPASNIAVVVLIGGARSLFGCEVSHLVLGSVVPSAGQGEGIVPPAFLTAAGFL